MLSCYAPTYASSREEKEAFFDSLQQAISAVPPGEGCVMLGDFNARVGSRLDEDEWWHVRGPNGYGETNEVGKELLGFRRRPTISRPSSNQNPSSGTA